MRDTHEGHCLAEGEGSRLVSAASHGLVKPGIPIDRKPIYAYGLLLLLLLQHHVDCAMLYSRYLTFFALGSTPNSLTC